MKLRFVWALAALVLITLWGTMVCAQVATSTPTFDPGTLGILDLDSYTDVAGRAFKSRKWMLLAGLLLTGVIAVVRTFGLAKKIKGEWVPWLTLGISMATSLALGLQQGKSWLTIIVGGLSVGITAIGGWEVFGKLVRNLIRMVKTKLGK
jgi:hypothetical protein